MLAPPKGGWRTHLTNHLTAPVGLPTNMTRKKWDVQNSVEAGGWGAEHHINNDTGIGLHVPATADLAVRLGRRCPHFAPMTALARLQFVQGSTKFSNYLDPS